MKNLINERPFDPPKPRQKESIRFVGRKDINKKVVLDIGCGYGWFEYYALSQDVKEIIGIEIAESDFKSAVRHIKDKRAKFRIGSAIKLPFKDNSFDTVVSWEVIEHIPKNTEKKMFSEIRRVLKKGGVFYLSTPYDSFWSKYFDPAWWLIGHRHYSEGKLRELGGDNLKVQKIIKKGKLWSLAFLLNMYLSKWILKRNPIFTYYFIEKEEREYKQDEGFMQILVKYKKTS